jgi:hypothetical protein
MAEGQGRQDGQVGDRGYGASLAALPSEASPAPSASAATISPSVSPDSNHVEPEYIRIMRRQPMNNLHRLALTTSPTT